MENQKPITNLYQQLNTILAPAVQLADEALKMNEIALSHFEEIKKVWYGK